MTTRLSESGATPALRSFCIGLPPQSTSTASPPPTKTMDVVSRSRAGTAPELPRKVKCTASGRGAGATQEHGHADQRQRDAHHARKLGDTDGSEHERVGAEGFGHEAAQRIEPQIRQEERARCPLEALAEDADEQGGDEEVAYRLVEESRVEELIPRELDGPVRR